MIVLAMMTQTVADDNDNIVDDDDDDDGDDSKGSDNGIDDVDDVDLYLGTVLLLPSVHVIDVSSSRRRRPGAGNSLKVIVIVIVINIVIAIVLAYVDHKKHNGILKVVVMAPCVEVGHLPHELVHVLNIFTVDGHLRGERRIKKYSQHSFCQIGGKLDCVSCVDGQKDV